MKSPALSQLKKVLREEPPSPVVKAPVAAPQPPAEPEVDDATLFAQATRGVKRMVAEAPPPPPPLRRPDGNVLRRRAAAVAEEVAGAPVSDTAAMMHAVGPEEALAFARNGVQQRVLQKLRAGQMPWQAAVDLHGCTVDQAREAVLEIVREGHREGLQVVKVVHGKGLMNGQALLKTCVNGWLRQLPEVLAFASCLPRDGGTGAVCVLLRRRREDDTTRR